MVRITEEKLAKYKQRSKKSKELEEQQGQVIQTLFSAATDLATGRLSSQEILPMITRVLAPAESENLDAVIAELAEGEEKMRGILEESAEGKSKEELERIIKECRDIQEDAVENFESTQFEKVLNPLFDAEYAQECESIDSITSDEAVMRFVAQLKVGAKPADEGRATKLGAMKADVEALINEFYKKYKDSMERDVKRGQTPEAYYKECFKKSGEFHRELENIKKTMKQQLKQGIKERRAYLLGDLAPKREQAEARLKELAKTVRDTERDMSRAKLLRLQEKLQQSLDSIRNYKKSIIKAIGIAVLGVAVSLAVGIAIAGALSMAGVAAPAFMAGLAIPSIISSVTVPSIISGITIPSAICGMAVPVVGGAVIPAVTVPLIGGAVVSGEVLTGGAAIGGVLALSAWVTQAVRGLFQSFVDKRKLRDIPGLIEDIDRALLQDHPEDYKKLQDEYKKKVATLEERSKRLGVSVAPYEKLNIFAEKKRHEESAGQKEAAELSKEPESERPSS